MKSLLNKVQKSYLLIAAGVLILANVLTFAPAVFALTYLVKPEVILTNMNAGAGSSVIIVFKTSASNTGTTLTLNFTGWTGGSAGSVNTTQATSQSYNGTNCTTIVGGSVSNLPGTPLASGSSSTVTFTGITAMTASTEYCVVLSSATAVTNPTSANSYPAVLTAGTDSAAPVAVDVITNDQIVVTATVPPSFTLALSSNTDPFTANLSVGGIGATTGVTATMTTNGTGWVLYGYDATTGLVSANASHTIASTTPGTTATLTAGSEGYVTAINSTSTVLAAYANSGFATPGKGSGLNTVATSLVSGAGPTASATAVFREYATISGITPAASDYTDTITLLGAGTF